jgi:hypothetical protein
VRPRQARYQAALRPDMKCEIQTVLLIRLMLFTPVCRSVPFTDTCLSSRRTNHDRASCSYAAWPLLLGYMDQVGRASFIQPAMNASEGLPRLKALVQGLVWLGSAQIQVVAAAPSFLPPTVHNGLDIRPSPPWSPSRWLGG